MTPPEDLVFEREAATHSHLVLLEILREAAAQSNGGSVFDRIPLFPPTADELRIVPQEAALLGLALALGELYRELREAVLRDSASSDQAAAAA